MHFARLGLIGGVGLLAVVTAAGCGSSGSPNAASATPASATTTTPTTTTNGNAPNSAAFQKFSACMTKHGVDVGSFGTRRNQNGGGETPPAGNPPTGTPPAGAQNGGGAPGGQGGQGGSTFSRRAANPKFQAAMEACRSLAPQLGTRRFGQGGPGGTNNQFQKFTACMKKNGVTLPTGGQSTAKPIDRTSAIYKKAEAACNSLLPGPGGTGRGNDTTNGNGTASG